MFERGRHVGLKVVLTENLPLPSIRASSMDCLLQKFHQILLKVVKTPYTSNSLKFLVKTLCIFNSPNPFSSHFFNYFLSVFHQPLQGELIPFNFFFLFK